MSTVIVELGRRDLVALNRRWLTDWRRIWPTFCFVFVVVTGFLLYMNGVPGTLRNWFALLAGGIGGAAGALVVGFLFSLLGIALHAGKVPGLLGRHEFSFVADGLLEKTAANETVTKWGGAVALVRTDHFLQIEVAPGLAHIVLRRAFPDQSAYNDFCDRALRLVPGAPNNTLEGTREG